MSSAFDFIVVGAGSAGCALAARLSEDPDAQVLLVEAGPPDGDEVIHVPAFLGKLYKSRFDWDFDSEREPHLGHRRTYLPRGRVLGGTSSLNGMIYIRGHRLDFEEWRDLGNPGWGFDDVLPHFLAGEDFEGGASEWHGAGGPLTVSEGKSGFPVMPAWLAAAEAAGLPRNTDFNAGEQDGVGYYQTTQRGGWRCSTAKGYLEPALERANLTVLTDALVTRVVLSGARAHGVEVHHGGRLARYEASAEVIVSCGAYNTPQVLMLSGIGPHAALAEHDIPCRLDLPVGENLIDHQATSLVFETATPTLHGAETPGNWHLLRAAGRGPLSSSIGEVGGFARTRPGLDAPDVQTFVCASMLYEEGLGAVTQSGFTVITCGLKPTSVGRVSLRSDRPDTKVRILHNHFATAEDRRVIREGLRLNMEIARQPELAAVITGRFRYPESDGDADLDAFITRYGHGLFHPAGTCALGAVVDHELRVLGTENLRVVDASIMPTHLRGNPNAAIVMAAEKAAAMIKAGSAPVA